MLIKVLLCLLLPIFLFGIYVIAQISYAYFSYYDPPKEIIIATHENFDTLQVQESFTSMIWNIGYCGLDAQADFFHDGGKMSRQNEVTLNHTLNGVVAEIRKQNSDFILLQEVDSHSKRSYFTDQTFRISNALDSFSSFFAKNYQVQYVPLPWLDPMGKVNSGLLTCSKFIPKKVIRYQLPGKFGFFKQLFFLRRCLLVSIYQVSNGKEFWVINLHNSAYDTEGKLRDQELDFLLQLTEEQCVRGNYVLVGGDWNECPSDFVYNKFHPDIKENAYNANMRKNFSQWLNFHYDPNFPTNRKLNKPFEKGKTFTTIIDYYLVSQNIQVDSVNTIPQDFKYSDHEKILLQFKLK
ncbi:MAG: endonuclease/exonuclease/phosphatase family protein [Chitinophagales bacterium]|nr:endonuclease/exonuclease/phosphatase family protein [Chitinophagales bacterium]